MAYSEEIITRGEQHLKELQQAHRNKQDALRQEIGQKLPRAAEIDRLLAQTAPRILAISLRKGLDSQEALAALRRENLALQDEQASILVQAGYEPNALDPLPLCPLCGDRGWKGSAMCTCLKELCKQEQIKSLSSMLNLGEQSFDMFRLDYYDREYQPEYRRSPRENMELVLTRCRNYAELFGSYPNKNLFLNNVFFKLS